MYINIYVYLCIYIYIYIYIYISTCPGGAQLGLPTWEQDGLEPGFQVGSKWASPFIKKISFTYALF